MLHYFAVCCSALHFVAVRGTWSSKTRTTRRSSISLSLAPPLCCSASYSVAVCCCILQCIYSPLICSSSVLQCVMVCCSMWQSVVVCRIECLSLLYCVLQCFTRTLTCPSPVPQYISLYMVHYSAMQCFIVCLCLDLLQWIAASCSELQRVAVGCSGLQ